MNHSLHEKIEGFGELCWMRIPVEARRISATLGAILSDGLYLWAWARIASRVLPAAFLAGLMLGWIRFVPGDSFTFSIAVMGFLLLAGSAAAAIGAWMFLGYVIGDFCLFHPIASLFSAGGFDELMYSRVPLLISYFLLASLMIFIPITARQLTRQTLQRLKGPRSMRLVIEAAVLAAIQAGLVYVWTQAVPTLLRPLYTWRGGQPPIEAIQPLQSLGYRLVWLGAFAGAARHLLEHRALMSPVVQQRLVVMRNAMANVVPRASLPLPTWAKAGLRACVAALMLSGLLSGWYEAVELTVALAALIYIREDLLARLSLWSRIVNKIPIVVRLVAGTIAAQYMGNLIVGVLWDKTEWYGQATFRPVLIASMISLLIFALLVPGQRPPAALSAARPHEGDMK